MPAYSPTGVLCVGLGRSPFDATRTVAQECNTIQSGCVIALSDRTVLWPKGSNQVVAAGSGFAAWIDVDGAYGDTLGRMGSDQYPQCAGPNKVVLIRPHSNLFAEILRADGSRTRINFDIKDPSFLPDGSLMYRIYPSTFIAPVASPSPDFSTWGWPSLVDGQLLYQQYGVGLVYAGKLIVPGAGDFFAPCGFRNPDGSYKFAWATEPEEYGHVPPELVLTRAQLASLPDLSNERPDPVPAPPPVPPPPPPKPMTNHFDVVQRERAKYPATIGDAECFAITNAVAADPGVSADGWGLTKAPSGGHGYIVGGQNYRVDKLCHPQGFICDILGSSGSGAAVAAWNVNADPNGNAGNWAAAIPGFTITPSVPPPPVNPTPPSPDLTTLIGLVAELHASVATLKAQVAQLQSAPAPVVPDLSQFAKRGGAVKVTGSVSLGDAWSSRKVTWDGTIL